MCTRTDTGKVVYNHAELYTLIHTQTQSYTLIYTHKHRLLIYTHIHSYTLIYTHIHLYTQTVDQFCETVRNAMKKSIQDAKKMKVGGSRGK